MINRKAFTLIETLVVLGLVVTVIAVGGVSLTNARDSIELDNSYSDVLSAIRTTQNNARNFISIEPDFGLSEVPTVPDVYGFRVNEVTGEFITYSCTGSTGTSNCSIASREFITNSISDVQIDSICYIIGFKKGIRDIIAVSESGTISDSGNCNITLSQGNRRKDVLINLNENNISIQ